MRTVWQYLKPHRGRMAVQLAIKLGGTVVELFLPSMLSIILDTYARQQDLRGVWMMGGAMLLCAMLAWIGNITANRMATAISRDTIIALRRDLFDKVTHLSAAQRDTLTESSLDSRLTSDTYNVHNMIDRMQRLGVRAPILLLGGIAVSFTLEPVLTLVLVCTLPFLAFVIICSSKKGIPLFTKVQEGQDHMVRKIQENMSGARVVRALSRTDYEIGDFRKVNDELAARQKKADLTMAAVSPATNFILNAGLAVVVLVGALRVQKGLAMPGTIIAFLSYFTIILNALLMVSRLFVLYSKGTASARRIESVLGLPAGFTRQDEPAIRTDAHITFNHVTFSYNKTTPNVSGLTFSLKHGETMGIIGPTGSGKSTILALIMRRYDADVGSILIDGKPIGSLTEDELHDRVGVVLQNDFLMADTIRENIRFGREIAEDRIGEAVTAAQAGFIADKSEGLNTLLNVKGRNLSGGQQQRVLIARALAGDPRLLMLDDCSSALDFRTDRALRRSIRERHGSATTIIVAQRVSSVMACDQILMMDRGQIIGRGTHEELVRTCPMYAELCRLQLGGDAP